MISFSATGDFKNTEKWLQQMSDGDIYRALDRFGAVGTAALRAATPVDTGLTAASWYHEIKVERGTYSIIWGNTNVVNGVPVAVLLQLGHGTGTGGYVAGRDYINPALAPVFAQIEAEARKAVTS